jgi:hypothetical protein
MSARVHFWLRVVGVAVILALQFGPKLLASRTASAASAAIARAGVIAR